MAPKRILFLDGKFLPADKVLEASLAPTKVCGVGVFETLLSRNGKVFFLKEHLFRLRKGAGYFGMHLPVTPRKTGPFIKRVVKNNKCSPARIRLLAWKDQGCVHTAITVCPQRLLSPRKYRTGFKAVIARQRLSAGKGLADVKSLKFQPYMTAYKQAAARGYDEALLFNTRGKLAEGSRTNLFFVHRGTLFTPSLESGCLNGVTRQIVLKLARQGRISVQEGLYKLDQLREADEAFVTNSIIGIMPLVRVNGRPIGRGIPGVRTKKLIAAYQQSLCGG